MVTKILNISIGKIKNYQIKNKQFNSAYEKDILLTTAKVSKNGIIGDEIADKKYHGDKDKAILFASSKHFYNFKTIYNKKFPFSGMGQNILVDNLDEENVCIGDIYKIGEVLVEVTQPRQPCWKIASIFDKEISRYINNYFATGWYVRVLNEGTININDKITLIDRKFDTTIKQLTKYLKNKPQKDIIEHLLSIKPLADAYKKDLIVT